MSEEHKGCYVIDGKLALPYQYIAGTLGSKFLVTLRDKKQILGVKCDKCNKTFVPPRASCEKCFTDISGNLVTLSNEGEVTNFTVVRKDDKHLPRKAPFVLAMIKLGGADTPMPHILEGVKPEDVKIGMKVKAVFSKAPTSTILDIDHFQPA